MNQRSDVVAETEKALGMMPISDKEFESVRGLIYRHFGINLTEQKRSLVVGRLQKMLKQKGYASFTQYLDSLGPNPSGEALADLVNRISTNHTYFFRENEHFEFLKSTALPEVTARLKASGSRDLRLWCAGCSTGEESCGLVMTLLEFFGPDYVNWDAGLLATDISEKVLMTAQRGVYPENRLENVPAAIRHKYFRKINAEEWEVSERVRREITLRRFNLMNETFPFRKPFHIIFCRNVMIYFDQPTRDALVDRFYRCTTPGGYLFIGHSETLGRGRTSYEYVKPAVYRKPG